MFLLMLLMFCLIFLIAVFWGCTKKISYRVPSKAPLIHLYALNGMHEILNMYEGEDLVIIFWSLKCGHSVSALRKINQKAKKNTQTKYLAVSLDDFSKKEEVQKLTLETPYLKHYFSGNGNHDPAWVALQGLAIPAIVYVDRFLNIKKAE